MKTYPTGMCLLSLWDWFHFRTLRTAAGCRCAADILRIAGNRVQRVQPRRAIELGDDGSNDFLVSEVLRTNELQVWFLSEHLVKLALLDAREPSSAAGAAWGRDATGIPSGG